MNLLAILEDLLKSPAQCGNTHIIAIDGRAGAGKTTLANELHLALSLNRSVAVIHLEEIYGGWEFALGETLTESLSRILNSVSAGVSVSFPVYDWACEQFGPIREIPPTTLLIIEGVGSAQKVVRTMASATIWIDIDQKTALKRVLERDGLAIQEEMDLWQIREERHFLSDATRENADFILATM